MASSETKAITLPDVQLKLVNNQHTTNLHALKLVGEALESQVATKKLSLEELELTHNGLAKLESFTDELVRSREATRESERAFATVYNELQKALKEKSSCNPSSRTRCVHEAVRMVRKLAKRRALSVRGAILSSTPASTLVPKHTSVAKASAISPVECLTSPYDEAPDKSQHTPVKLNPHSSSQEHHAKTQARHEIGGDSVLTPKHSREHLPFECEQLSASIQQETSYEHSTSCVLAHVTELVAARRCAEEATHAAHISINTIKKDVSKAWNVLAIPREAPTRSSVEGFAAELESLLQEKDVVTTALAQMTDEKCRALESAVEAKKISADHANALKRAESELLSTREQIVELKTQVSELAELNQITRRQLAAERSRLQRIEREKEVIIALEDKERRRADLLQAEARELRWGLRRRVHESYRHQSLAKKACADLERERTSTQLSQIREQELEVKVCELANELTRQNTDSIAVFNTRGKKQEDISESDRELVSKEMQLLVHELAREGMRANLRAEKAEAVAADAFKEIRALKARVNKFACKNSY